MPDEAVEQEPGRVDSMLSDEDEYEAEDNNLEPTERVDADDEFGVEADDVEDVSQLEIEIETFGELRLSEQTITKVQAGLALLIEQVGSVEAAGEAIYSTLFEAAPSLQSLYKTPRAVQGMKFALSIALIISKLREPEDMKIIVEQLGFQHITTDVTIPRIEVFRDALLEMFASELGDDVFTMDVRVALARIFNYMGGSFIYVRSNYWSRLQLIQQCWSLANRHEGDGEVDDDGNPESSIEKSERSPKRNKEEGHEKTGGGGLWRSMWKKKPQESSDAKVKGSQEASMEEGRKKVGGLSKNKVPTTFPEMFRFNATVMGYGNSEWMAHVLDVFPALVVHAADPQRVMEEADVLSIVLGKSESKIEFMEFKAVLLASLRSLLPKTWNSECEVAWTWLWDSIHRMLKANLGKPQIQQKALRKLYSTFTEEQLLLLRTGIYTTFFAKCAQGQDYFKQSSTRLHFIADRVIMFTQEIFKDPKSVMTDLSALGLRHVGYGIPTELFGPFVSSAIEKIRELTNVPEQEEAFRWSLGLISRVLCRTITEGSTLVMRAINANCAKLVRKAVSNAPRAQRAEWMLRVQVGTQSISPLLWSIQSGSLEAGQAILTDLLTIRADRDHYYYAMDALFNRHPDIVRRICQDGPELLPTLFDGLIWRSRQTHNGMRRVNYFIKYMIVDAKNEFSESFRDVVVNGDPVAACHPSVILSADILWSRLASYTFLTSKLWFLLNLLVFVVTQAVFTNYSGESSSASIMAVFIGRIFIYVFGLGQLVLHHMYHFSKACRNGEVRKIAFLPIPEYLLYFSEALSASLCTVLMGMLAQEPLLHCLGNHAQNDKQFSELDATCQGVQDLIGSYATFAFLATLLYFLLLLELTVFSTKLSTFVLVCGRMVQEVAQYLFALFFVVVAFGCAIASSDVVDQQFEDILPAMLNLSRIILGTYSSDEYQKLELEPKLLISVSIFVICTTIFLFNLLIAQLNCAYMGVFKDMLGYARLNRGSVILENVSHASAKRWERFVVSLKMDEKLEFNEGDIGLAGGIQVLEPAGAHPVTTDSIKRYGGSTSPASQWPETANEVDIEDKVDRLERIIEKAVKKIVKSTGKGAHGAQSGVSGASSSSSMSSGSSGGDL